MKALVVGLGSMGKRRTRLMLAFAEDVTVVGVDSNEQRRKEFGELFSSGAFASVAEAVSEFSPDVGFVCSPPLTHGAIIGDLLLAGVHVFSEINLASDRYDENILLAKQRGLVLFLSSTPMYRKEIEYITGQVGKRKGLCYRYHVGQYLPDWHPWESYTAFFAADSRTNGCRELFAIELPWIVNAFGEVSNLTSEAKRLSALDIDYPDCFAVTLSHKSGVMGQLMVDVVSRKAVRELEVFSEDLYLRWGGAPDSLYHYDIAAKLDRKIVCYEDILQDTRYSDNIVENAYVEEIHAFFDFINGIGTPKHSFEADREIVALLDVIEGKSE